MRLCSITLHDVRRFTDTVRIEGIGPGVSVLTAPNEQGKSTLFDALQALFFQPHSSKAREVKSLRPHAGGAPVVSAEIETGEGRFRITKRWLSRPIAEVRQDSRLVAKGDVAEEWIAAQVRAGAHGGPAGLLWVRQGLTALDGGEKSDKPARLVRRDLLSSVAGEVDAMTGGRRMERARGRCEAELGDLVTNSGKSKAGGPLKAAEDELVTLEGRHAELSRLSEEMRGALEERRRLRRESDELHDPAQSEAARIRLEDVRGALESAKRHAERLDQAGELTETARKARDHAAERLAALRKGRAALAECSRNVDDTVNAEAEASQSATDAEAARANASRALTAARKVVAEAEQSLRQLASAERAAEARKRRKALSAQIDNARTLHKNLRSAQSTASAGPTDKALAALEAAVNDLRVQEALQEQSAPWVTMRYARPEAPRARLAGGAELEDGKAVALPRGADIELPGLGTLAVNPGTRADSDDALAAARATLEARLAAIGASTAEKARAMGAARRQAETKLREIRAALAAVAPDGVATLEAELAALGESDDAAGQPDTDLPDRNAIELALSEARSTLDAADRAAERAVALAQAASIGLARATAGREAAERRLAEAKAALSEFADAELEENQRAEALREAEAHFSDAAAKAKRLAEAAPDLAVVDAAVRRAQSVVAANEARLRELDRRLAELDTLIDVRAGEGIEEELADTAERLARARERLDQLTFERDMLSLLRAELDTARTAAREHYFKPVTRELQPLLNILWPDAVLSFDDETVLPSVLVRNGQEEPIDVLSGGTREQIALLVRLAFARLLARGGRPAPIILDDALVFTDDDRIERMFDALHRQADDMQILVLSCRQRAFRALGGTALGFVRGALPEEAA